jgi:hypothetical protein
MSQRGVSLIELVAGIAVSAMAFLTVVKWWSSSNQMNSDLARIAQTEQTLRLFLETQKKHISLAGNLNPVPTINSFLLPKYALPSSGPSQPAKYYCLQVPRLALTETIWTACLKAPSSVALSPGDLALMTDCTPCGNQSFPAIRFIRSDQPGLTFRFSGAQESSAPSLASLADDGTTLAESLCVNSNASQTLFNLRLRALVRFGNGTRVIEMSASVPIPQANPAGIQVLSTGP